MVDQENFVNLTERLSPICIKTDINVPDSQTTQSVLFQSDQHFDSVHCMRDMLERHLKEAVAADAPIYFLGDWYDMMQGRNDPRRNKGSMRQGLMADNYIDRAIDETVEFLTPYCKNIVGWAKGNHETAILRHLETDVINRTIESLRHKGADIKPMGYQGWIFFRLHREPTKKTTRRTDIHTVRTFFTHGYGGAAPVTKGVIQANRKAVYLPDADIVISGHTHQQWDFPINRYRISQRGVVYTDTQYHLQLPCYLDPAPEDSDGMGWAIEKGFPPTPTGAWWVDFCYTKSDNKRLFTIDARRAQ
mgnify:FL=1|jgi:UDP-2,3-diacylglucosamine pyrophosphatase LpxH